MEKTVAVKAMEGGLLSRLSDSGHFIMLSAFGLYCDSFLILTSNNGLLQLYYRVGDALSLGGLFVIVASFSLLAIYLCPAMFSVLNTLVWELWYSGPVCKIYDKIVQNDNRWPWRNSSWCVSKHKLKLWAIKTNNAVAMSLATNNEAAIRELRINQPKPFLLVLCMLGNYFFAKNGMLQAIENSLPIEYRQFFIIAIIAFSLFLLYGALAAIPYDVDYITLPGLKEHIDRSENS